MVQIRPRTERKVFQIAVYVGSIVPIGAGVAGCWYGPAFVDGFHSASRDLESHFRYLSGLLLALGVLFMFCAADIKRRAALFRALAITVIVGGFARLLGVGRVGLPSAPQQFGLLMELVFVPTLILWLRRIESLPHAEERT